MQNSLTPLELLIMEGWEYHDTDSERLADELEVANIDEVDVLVLAKTLVLANHTIGEHLGDWSRALEFIEKVCNANSSHLSDASALTQLAVARYMNGLVVPAMEAEISALSHADDPTSAYTNLKSKLASALVGSGKVDEATCLIKALNSFAAEFAESLPVARSLAISNNNIASELLNGGGKEPSSDALMIECAHSALFFWRKCGTWVNEERGHYLLALVYNRLREYPKALEHSNHALRVIYANGKEDVDEAFIRLAAAMASCGDVEDAIEPATMLTKADQLVTTWTDNALIAEYRSERAAVAAKLSLRQDCRTKPQ